MQFNLKTLKIKLLSVLSRFRNAHVVFKLLLRTLGNNKRPSIFLPSGNRLRLRQLQRIQSANQRCHLHRNVLQYLRIAFQTSAIFLLVRGLLSDLTFFSLFWALFWTFLSLVLKFVGGGFGIDYFLAGFAGVESGRVKLFGTFWQRQPYLHNYISLCCHIFSKFRLIFKPQLIYQLIALIYCMKHFKKIWISYFLIPTFG